MEESLIETLKRGLEDEMSSVRKYVALAAKCGDLAIQSEFLSYAAEELEHARKLTDLVESLHGEVGILELKNEEPDEDTDLFETLIEYIAEEESAVFYYDALEKLAVDEHMREIASQIRGEERLHYLKIKEIFEKLKKRSAGKGL